MEAKPKPAATGRGSTIHDNSSLKEMLSKPNGFQMSLRRRSSSSSVLRMPPLPTAFFQIDSAAAPSSILDNDTDTATSSLLAGTTTSTNSASLALQFLDGNKLEEEEEEEEALEEEEEKEEEEEAEGEEASLCSDSCSISSRSETMMELETAAGPDTVIDQEEEEEEEGEEEGEEEPSSSSDSCSRSRSGLKRAEPDAVVDQEEEEEGEEEEAKQAIIDPVMIEDNAVDLSPAVSQEGTEEAEEEASVLAPLSKKAKTTSTIKNTNSTCMMKATPSSSATTSTKLDHIDLDHITVNDLQGLRSEDGDVLRAKQFHQLSKREREHVLYDIHGVADSYNTTTDTDTAADVTADDVNDDSDSSSVKDLRVELTNELMRRKKKMNKDEKKNNGTTATATSTEGTTADIHEGPQDDDDVVAATIATGVTATTAATTTTTDDSNSSNKDDYLGNIFKMDYPTTRSSHRNSAATNALFSIPSGLFSDSSSNNNATLSLTSAYAKALATTAQCDAALLDSSSKATAYEQALAQCRGRRRERNNSLFRDDTDDAAAAADDDDEHIDVESSEFLTSFLQCEEQRFENEKENDSTSTSTTTTSTTRLLQVRKAACRILDYFEEKKTLFGVDLLTTRIQFQTLDHETQQLLESGCIQLLSEHDRAGRAVIVGTKKLVPDNNNNTAVLRAFWFLSSVALEDREIETKGIVFVYYTLGGTSSINTDTEIIDDQQRQRCVVAKWGNVLQALPLRVASIHWCVENTQEETATNLSALLLGRSNFVRVRCHRGTDSEVQYQLMTFGIPTQLFPIQMNGEVNLDNVCLHVRDFVQQRKMVEQEGHSHLLNKALAVLDDSSSSPLLSSTILNLNDCIALVEGEDENDDIDTDVDTVCSTGGESVLINTSIFSPNNLLVDDNTSQHHHQQQQHADQNNICGIPFNDMFLLNNNNNSMNMNMNTSNNGRPSNNHHHHHHLMQYPPATLPPLSSLSTSSLEYHLYQQQQQQQRHHQQQQLQQEKQLLVRQLQKHQQELRLQAEKQILVNQLQKQQQELGQLMESQQQHHIQQQQLQSSSTSTPTTIDPATISPTISPPPTDSSTKKGGKKTNKSTTIVEDPEVDIVPGETDILLGRGRGAQNHKGNIHYRHVVETFRKQYEEIPNKGEKTLFIREVVDIIYDNGGQFLKKNPNGSGKWVRINPDVAREKVSHSFRNAKRLEGYEKAESN